MMTRRTNRCARGWTTRARMLVVVPALAMPAFVAGAQSNLSGQGFGYPSGQFSTRAQGTGGAVGEMDPFSPINPATIGSFTSRILFFQMEPEYRSVSSPAGTERTTTARYPIVFGAMPIGTNFVASLSASSLLDRTATTSFNTTQIITGGESVPMTTTYRIEGGIEDVRLAGAWTPRPWLRVGAGIHGITGSNLISLTQTFADSVRFAAFTQQRILGYHGTAGSVGIQLLTNQVVAAASGRFGGSLHLSSEDTLLATGERAEPIRRVDRLRRHCQFGDLGPHLARELVVAGVARHAWADWGGRLGYERRWRLRRAEDRRADRVSARRISRTDAAVPGIESYGQRAQLFRRHGDVIRQRTGFDRSCTDPLVAKRRPPGVRARVDSQLRDQRPSVTLSWKAPLPPQTRH